MPIRKRRVRKISRLSEIERRLEGLERGYELLMTMVHDLRQPNGRNCNDCGFKLTRFDTRCPTHPNAAINFMRSY